jgi:hypothetical protein
MGFEGEYASYEPLRRIVSSEKLDAMRKRFVLRKQQSDDENTLSSQLIRKDDLELSQTHPDLVLAIDGSFMPVKVLNGFPGAEVGYITVASVLLNLNKIKNAANNDIINPKEFRETEKASTIDYVLPGCNVILDNCDSAKASMRKALFEQIVGTKIFEQGETLLETYEHLLKMKLESVPDVHRPKSPFDDIDADDLLEYGYGEYKSSTTGKPLYSTDALRLHELFLPSNSCGEMFGQVMSTLEKLLFIHILRSFEKRNWLPTLRRVAFVMDGPLAVFSTSSWLVKVIEKELIRINSLQKKINKTDLFIIGIEKSGTFVNHFNEIDISLSGESNMFPDKTALLLDDTYIKKNIIFSESKKPYGQDTYFGRKFFYKTKTGQRIVANVAFYNDKQKNLNTALPSQFVRLGDTMELLDNLVSSRYPNSLVPLISAHSEAAIPLNLGTRIFEKIADEIRNQTI